MKNVGYSTLPLKDRLVNKILVYYQTIWAEKRFNSSAHKRWLENFKEEERLNSLFLLSKFMFFGTDEIRELLVSIYRDKFKYKIVEKFRKDNSDTLDFKLIEAEFSKILNDTRFVSLGGVSESGAEILMKFRQYNKLSTRFMKSSLDILRGGCLVEPTIRHYIFIDDFCGSGETAVNHNDLIQKIKAIDSRIKVSYFVLFATEDGFDNLSRFSKFDNFEASYVLDNSYKSFNHNSRYYLDVHPDISKIETKVFCASYGVDLVKDSPVEGHPLGFADGQLLLSFAHNTPDNSLPIFWSAKNWNPIFLRYIKDKS